MQQTLRSYQDQWISIILLTDSLSQTAFKFQLAHQEDIIQINQTLDDLQIQWIKANKTSINLTDVLILQGFINFTTQESTHLLPQILTIASQIQLNNSSSDQQIMKYLIEHKGDGIAQLCEPGQTIDKLKIIRLSESFFQESISLRKQRAVEELYHYNIQVQMMTQCLVPINLDPEKLLSELTRLFNVELDIKNNIIEEANSLTCRTLVKSIEAMLKLFQLPEKMSFHHIKDIILLNIEQNVKIPAEIQRQADFKEQLKELIVLLLEEFMRQYQQLISNSSITQTLILFIQNDKQSKQFVDEQVIFRIFEHQLKCICMPLAEFATHNSDTFQLLKSIKQQFFDYIYDIHLYLIQCSQFAQDQMKHLEELLKSFPCLANVTTFKQLQRETAQNIWQCFNKEIDDSHFFLRPEHSEIRENLVRQSIGNFYDYSTVVTKQYQMPYKPRSLAEIIEVQQQTVIYLPALGFYEDQVYSSGNIDLVSSNLLKKKKIWGDTSKWTVKQYQQIASEGYSLGVLEIFEGEEYVDTVAVQVDRILIIKSINYLYDYEVTSEIEQLNVPFETFLQSKLSLPVKKNQENTNLKENNAELLINYDLKNFKKQKKFKPQMFNQKSIGNLSSSQMTSGCIGAGLGSLILDSMDESIPWEEKLRRAGHTTVQNGVMATALYAMPAVSSLLIQVFVAYQVKKLASNEVLNTNQKFQKVVHMGVQSSVGVSSAIAGQMLIPIPVLGAIIGGAIGGIAVGLYQKVIVPKTKASIFDMLSKLESKIEPCGLILYSDDIIKILKIQKKHFELNQPENLTKSQWLTLAIINLVNEILYLAILENEEEIIKLTEKSEQNSKQEKKLEEAKKKFHELEKKMQIWQPSQDFIVKEKISTLVHARNVGIFVEGMIQNFRM